MTARRTTGQHCQRMKDEGSKQQNPLQEGLSKVTAQESMTIFYLLQQQIDVDDEEVFKVFRVRSYLLLAVLKFMHRMNGEVSGLNKNG